MIFKKLQKFKYATLQLLSNHDLSSSHELELPTDFQR